LTIYLTVPHANDGMAPIQIRLFTGCLINDAIWAHPVERPREAQQHN
jgi:hypothetical protein